MFKWGMSSFDIFVDTLLTLFSAVKSVTEPSSQHQHRSWKVQLQIWLHYKGLIKSIFCNFIFFI